MTSFDDQQTTSPVKSVQLECRRASLSPAAALLAWLALGALLAGCIPQLPANAGVEPPERTLHSEAGGARFWNEPGVDDALWIEMPGADGQDPVGGYLWLNESSRNALVILLRGASTYEAQGSAVATRWFGQTRGQPFRDAGYRTLSLQFPECGTAYGREDLDHLLQTIDWLNAGGAQILGIERIYLFGYSVGATSAMLANRQRQVAAIAAVGGVTVPDQFERSWQLYQLVSLLYPGNEGICHLRTTLSAYGPPGSGGWQLFDIAGRVHELRSPMLVIQGTRDQIYSVSNAQNLQAAYQQALDSGMALPVVEFLFLQDADHFYPISDPAVFQAALDFFARFGD